MTERKRAGGIGFDETGTKILLVAEGGPLLGMPRGGIESGETAEHAAIRELAEEAGAVLVGPLTAMGCINFPRYHDSGKYTPIHTYTEEVGGTPKPNTAWVGEAELTQGWALDMSGTRRDIRPDLIGILRDIMDAKRIT
jgi:ADP-ribose pyrophosphatase YjhB (NUDIX family)